MMTLLVTLSTVLAALALIVKVGSTFYLIGLKEEKLVKAELYTLKTENFLWIGAFFFMSWSIAFPPLLPKN